MKRIALLVMLLFSGCICGSGSQDSVSPVASAASVAVTDVQADRVSAGEGPLIASTTTVASSVSGGVSVRIAGCDDDRFGNARVGGFVTNGGASVAPAFTLVVQLQDSAGSPVSGGEKRLRIDGLGPNEARKFSADFQKPGPWRKCRAYIP